MLTENDLTGIRWTVEQSFPDTIVVRRFTTTTDDYGNEERGTATNTSYAGRLIQRDATERTEDGQVTTSDWSVLLPHDADVESSDQIIAGGYTFEVAGPPVWNPSPGQATHLRVALRHVSG